MAQPTTQREMRSRDAILAALAAQALTLRRLGVTSLGLFGSFARNQQRPESDVDLLVTFDHVTFRNFMDAKLLLEETLSRPVDLALADDLHSRIRATVMSEVIYVEGLSPLS